MMVQTTRWAIVGFFFGLSASGPAHAATTA